MNTETVQISISASKLMHVVAGGKSSLLNTFAVATVLPNNRETKHVILGKTEV